MHKYNSSPGGGWRGAVNHYYGKFHQFILFALVKYHIKTRIGDIELQNWSTLLYNLYCLIVYLQTLAMFTRTIITAIIPANLFYIY